MRKLESLTGEEAFVLKQIKRVKKPIGEHMLHMIFSVSVKASGIGLYEFEPKVWEHIDERYITGQGHLPYSSKLHEQVESLVRKGYLKRDSDEPIIIFENKQLDLFSEIGY